MHITQALVHVVGWVILTSAVTFCAACGLYVAAEWLEDHVRTRWAPSGASSPACNIVGVLYKHW
jgi:hypothetical protein